MDAAPRERAKFRMPTPESLAAMDAEGERRAAERASEQGNPAATVRQLRYLQAVAREAKIDAAVLDEMSVQAFGVKAAALSRRDASTLIDLIQRKN